MELTLKGTRHSVCFRMHAASRQEYSRGDHGMGGGYYSVEYGVGDVTVRRKDGECIAACNLSYSEWGKGGHQPVNDEAFKMCVEVPGILTHKRREYIDWLADLWIKRFRANREPGIPGFTLEAPPAAELIRLGFMPDEVGQTALPLEPS